MTLFINIKLHKLQGVQSLAMTAFIVQLYKVAMKLHKLHLGFIGSFITFSIHPFNSKLLSVPLGVVIHDITDILCH